jgi:hypothetical protein
MHSLIYRIFSFVLFIVVSVGFIAVGLLIAFWPDAYARWVHRSNVERNAPWLVRGLDFYSWPCRMVGIWIALFGVTAVILSVWIHWFQ